MTLIDGAELALIKPQSRGGMKDAEDGLAKQEYRTP